MPVAPTVYIIVHVLCTSTHRSSSPSSSATCYLLSCALGHLYDVQCMMYIVHGTSGLTVVSASYIVLCICTSYVRIHVRCTHVHVRCTMEWRTM